MFELQLLNVQDSGINRAHLQVSPISVKVVLPPLSGVISPAVAGMSTNLVAPNRSFASGGSGS
jgi:hypothetical protein